MTRYNGINHLAMATCDLDSTIRYYRDLLGMRLLVSLGHRGYKHYFFEISKTDMIAFFEWPHVRKIPEKDHGVPVKEPFAFDHVSIGVNSFKDLLDIKKMLAAAGFWVSEIVDHGFINSIYSFDPNNIPIEFSYCVPGKDIRALPVLKDKDPSKTAIEGSNPQPGKWPSFNDEDGSSDDLKVYPGEGTNLFED
ncbi:MAG: VOC family protein [Pseudomonadota bacterium]